MNKFFLILIVLGIGLAALGVYYQKNEGNKEKGADSIEKAYDETTGAIKDTVGDVNKAVYN